LIEVIDAVAAPQNATSKTLLKGLMETVDLTVITLDCIDAADLPKKVGKTLKKLQGSQVLLVLTDCEIMFDQ
jgi:hypothetical protein